MSKKQLNTVFLIAGSEPLGSAGMQADIKAITACGGYAACALTAIVDEDTQHVKSITPLPVELVVSQTESFLGDVGAQCVKTGVLPSLEIIRGVAETLRKYSPLLTPFGSPHGGQKPQVEEGSFNRVQSIVIDPVIVNSVGEKLVADEAIQAYRQLLFPLATLITPNHYEADVLLGHHIEDVEKDLRTLGESGCSVIVKSVNDPEHPDILTDYFYNHQTDTVRAFRKPRIDTHNVNGTGDSFASAIATYLAKGYTLEHAVEKGEEFIQRAITLGAEYRFGHDFGPVHPCFMEDKEMHNRIYD